MINPLATLLIRIQIRPDISPKLSLRLAGKQFTGLDKQKMQRKIVGFSYL